jgi:hypothetical protein
MRTTAAPVAIRAARPSFREMKPWADATQSQLDEVSFGHHRIVSPATLVEVANAVELRAVPPSSHFARPATP